MTDWHGYFGVENLGLNATQRATLVAELRALGPANHRSPDCLNHWRANLNGEAVILEALFDEDNLTITKFKQRLANMFGVDVGDIGHNTTNHSFAGWTTPVVAFDYNSVDRLRVVLFGGVGADWNESGDECRAYLLAHRDRWEGVEVDGHSPNPS